MTVSAPARTLPQPRGPVSEGVLTALHFGRPHSGAVFPDAVHARPFGGDAQLALYACYELHYRGFPGVPAEWEWDTGLLDLRRRLEHAFLQSLHAAVRDANDPEIALDTLCVEPVDGAGISDYLSEHATWDQMREFFAHRSIYHLKEADPHAWAIPRLTGRSKASFVAVEYDEYGAGRADRMHATLFGDLLDAAELDSGYLAYIDCVPPEILATVNFMSMCGLHRQLRGALVGLFAAAEITTAPSARRIVAGLNRLGAPQACKEFYTEHIEADAVHEQILRHDVIGDLLEREPDLAADVAFGIAASEFLESRFATAVLDRWRRGITSLLPFRAR